MIGSITIESRHALDVEGAPARLAIAQSGILWRAFARPPVPRERDGGRYGAVRDPRGAAGTRDLRLRGGEMIEISGSAGATAVPVFGYYFADLPPKLFRIAGRQI